MLQKNVYILYPPGYSGSYISWAINAADVDASQHTVSNPINVSPSAHLGGSGTSHLHTRIPTHQSIQQHLIWVLYNKPQECKTYIINVDEDDVYQAIDTIRQYDPTSVFINIHNGNNEDIDSYGTINCVTKWPTFMEVCIRSKTGNSKYYSGLPDNFDPFNCSSDILFRNQVVKTQQKMFRHPTPLNREFLNNRINRATNWFNVRNRRQPHEVNETMYITDTDLSNRLYELDCKSIVNNNFISWFEQFMLSSKVSTNWNIDPITQIHDSYILAQENLQWFKSVANWESTGQLDNYLRSHSIIEAQVLIRILKKSSIVNLDWEKLSLTEINNVYQGSIK